MVFAPPYRYMLSLASKPQQNTHNSYHKNNGAPLTNGWGTSVWSPLRGACSIAHCVRQPLIRGTHLHVTTQLHHTLVQAVVLPNGVHSQGLLLSQATAACCLLLICSLCPSSSSSSSHSSTPTPPHTLVGLSTQSTGKGALKIILLS